MLVIDCLECVVLLSVLGNLIERWVLFSLGSAVCAALLRVWPRDFMSCLRMVSLRVILWPLTIF